jgi:prevent-host-death family protein
MATRSVAHVKAHLEQVIETARQTGQVVMITQNGEGTAVLQDIASYQATRQTMVMLKLVAQGGRELARGKGVSQKEVFRTLRRKLGKK